MKPRIRVRCWRCDKQWRRVVESGLCRICLGRPRVRSKTPAAPEGKRCESCQVRYAQERGLCRGCQHEQGIAVPRAIEAAALHVAAQAARFNALRPAVTVRPVRDVEADGVVYEAVDLSVRALAPGELERALAEARGIPQRGIW